MVYIVLVFLAAAFLCGCTSNNSAQTLTSKDKTPAAQLKSRNKPQSATSQRQKRALSKNGQKRQSVSGVFCGDKDVGDDF